MTITLTGKNAIEYIKAVIRPRMDENIPGLMIFGNEVDGDGVENATLGHAIDAADEDGSLVSYGLTEKTTNAEFFTMAETAAGSFRLEKIEKGIASVTWDADQIDWQEIIPPMFRGHEEEIKGLAEQCYQKWMKEDEGV